MTPYLLRCSLNGAVAYKAGVSKWGTKKLLENRFGDNYNVFDNVEVLAGVHVTSPSYAAARGACFGVEHAIHCLFPKNFCLEEHFHALPNTFDNLSGITEFFLLPDWFAEKDLIAWFNRMVDNQWKLNGKLQTLS